MAISYTTGNKICVIKNVHFMYHTNILEKHQQGLTNQTQHVWCQKYTHMKHISQLRYDEVPSQMTAYMKRKTQNIFKYNIKKLCQYMPTCF
jgi:hypothetical protein